jgi:hypothetical protein
MEGHDRLSNWAEGHCESTLHALGYEDARDIVVQWGKEALEKKANEVTGEQEEGLIHLLSHGEFEVNELQHDDRFTCPHCKERVTTHLDGWENTRVLCDECGGDLGIEPDEEVTGEEEYGVNTAYPGACCRCGSFASETFEGDGNCYCWDCYVDKGYAKHSQYEDITKQPVHAVCFSAQPVANGSEVPVLEGQSDCPRCHGRYWDKEFMGTINGMREERYLCPCVDATHNLCPECDGEGTEEFDGETILCQRCEGEGIVPKTQPVAIGAEVPVLGNYEPVEGGPVDYSEAWKRIGELIADGATNWGRCPYCNHYCDFYLHILSPHDDTNDCPNCGNEFHVSEIIYSQADLPDD